MYENYLKLRTQCTTGALDKWQQCGFWPDKAQSVADPSTATDAGIKARYDKFGKGQLNKLFFPIMTGVASQLRALPSLLALEIKLTKSPVGWKLHGPIVANTEYDLTLVSCILHIRRILLYPATLSRLENRLASSHVKIFFQVSVRSSVHPSVRLLVRPLVYPSVRRYVTLSLLTNLGASYVVYMASRSYKSFCYSILLELIRP